MNNKIVVGLGEILWDIFPERKILGGAPANFAYHASQLGCNGYAVSAVGNDDLGRDILNNLEQKKLHHLIKITDFPTGTVNVSLDEKGIPTYEICENVAWDNIPFSIETENLAKQTSCVCFGSLAQRSDVSRDTIRQFVASMTENSLKILDINFRQNFYTKEIIQESLKMSNALKINDEEIKILANLFNWNSGEQEISRRLISDYNLDILILTKGVDGSFIFTPDMSSYLSTPKVEVADTVGAGDSFTAGFVAAYLQGKTIEEAHRLAVDVSAYVCTQDGAMPKLPDVLPIFV